VVTVKNDLPTRGRGRPRAFDRDAALATAARTFWRLGYEGASIVDLTTAMGITPQSLYAAFGSKAELYREALDWYRSISTPLTQEMLDRPDVLATLGEWLVGLAHFFADPVHPPGCMISTAMLFAATENQPIAEGLADKRRSNLARIRARVERAQAEGEVAPEVDPAALARFIGAIVQGMAVQARDGASQAELADLARLAAEQLRRYGTKQGRKAR
jgi:AcrR family transcriptional regulator